MDTMRMKAGKGLQYMYKVLVAFWTMIFIINLPYTWYRYGFRAALAYALPLSSAGLKLYFSMALLFLPILVLRYISRRLLMDQ